MTRCYYHILVTPWNAWFVTLPCKYHCTKYYPIFFNKHYHYMVHCCRGSSLYRLLGQYTIPDKVFRSLRYRQKVQGLTQSSPRLRQGWQLIMKSMTPWICWTWRRVTINTTSSRVKNLSRLKEIMLIKDKIDRLNLKQLRHFYYYRNCNNYRCNYFSY